jgi:putative ABC transport system substrate-binding protein
MLKEMAPATKRVLIMISSIEAPGLESLQPVEEAAKKLRIELVRREATSKADIEKILAETPKGSIDAIFFFPSTLVGANIGMLISKAKEDKIPLAVPNESMVTQGALFAYGTDLRRMGVQAARLMAKVLKGEKPSDIPIETPEKFFLAVNLTVAKAIGLKIPRAVLERVDRVVE